MLIDNLVMSYMQSIESSGLTSFMKIISTLTEPLVLLIVSLVLGVYFYFKKSRKEGVLFVSLILIASILVKILKEIFQRARPLNSIIVETGYSLPSGHALISLVFFGSLVYLFLRKKDNLFLILSSTILVLLIGFSRLYLRVHWFTDVLAGYLIGIIILIIGILTYKKLVD